MVNWWFFWPFCPLGWHSRFPAVMMHATKDEAEPRTFLGCRACSKELQRYNDWAEHLFHHVDAHLYPYWTAREMGTVEETRHRVAAKIVRTFLTNGINWQRWGKR